MRSYARIGYRQSGQFVTLMELYRDSDWDESSFIDMVMYCRTRISLSHPKGNEVVINWNKTEKE